MHILHERLDDAVKHEHRLAAEEVNFRTSLAALCFRVIYEEPRRVLGGLKRHMRRLLMHKAVLAPEVASVGDHEHGGCDFRKLSHSLDLATPSKRYMSPLLA